MKIRVKISIILIACYCISLFMSCKTETYSQGKRLYTAYCANCHMDDGSGLENLIPPLAQSDYLKKNQDITPCIILHGQQGPVYVNGVVYNQNMPAQNYSEVQINNIINYINHSWGNDIEPVSITTTKKRLGNCKDYLESQKSLESKE